MSITYIIEFKVRPSRLERFRGLLYGVLDAMRHEPNFRNAIFHQDPDNPNRFLLHETWADHDDVLTNQLERDYRKEWHQALPDLLEVPRSISIWQPLRADGAKL